MTVRSILFAAFAAVVLSGTAVRAAESERHKGHAAFKAACGADVEKFCPDAAHGKAVFECLKTHKGDLSDTCKTFQEQHQHPQGEGQHPQGEGQPAKE